MRVTIFGFYELMARFTEMKSIFALSEKSFTTDTLTLNDLVMDFIEMPSQVTLHGLALKHLTAHRTAH